MSSPSNDYLYRLTFSRINEYAPDPSILEDNGLRKPKVEVYMKYDSQLSFVITAMCKDGWTLERITETLECQERQLEDE